MAERSTFVPTVVAGIGGTALTAVAGYQPMLRIPSDYLTSIGLQGFGGTDTTSVEFQLVGSLALVGLACWGVLLVARGRFRRTVAVLAVVASLGAVAALVVGGFVQDDDAARDLATQLGAASFAGGEPPIDPTPWFWVGCAGALIALAAGVAAVRFVPTWPEMGSRYDAPTSSGAGSPDDGTPVEERSSIDIWRSLDEGEDPTA